jgi:coenzyme F420-reducing hydrogenase alpha subunit
LVKNLGEAIERALQNRADAISKAAEEVRQKQLCGSTCFIEAGEGTLFLSLKIDHIISGGKN